MDEIRGFEYGQVLAYRLPGQAETVIGDEPGAYLEEGLAVPFHQFVKDAPTGGVGQRLEDILCHRSTIGKSSLAYQAGRTGGGVGSSGGVRRERREINRGGMAGGLGGD